MQKSKGNREKGGKERKWALMCDSGPEASPKDGVVGDGGYIASEHESHAQNDENAGIHITGVFAREKPCLSYIGGGGGTRTPVRKRVIRSVYERSPHFGSRALGSCRRDPLAPVRKVVLVS